METKASPSYETASPQTPQPNVWAVGAKGGLYTGLVLILFSLVTYVFVIQDTWFGVIYQTLTFGIGIFLTHKAFKDQGNGYLSYGQGLGLASVLGMVGGALVALFSVVYLTVIDDTVLQRMMEQARTQLEDQGLTDAQIDQGLAMTEMMQNPLFLFFSTIISCIFYAFLISLLVSAFTKNTDPTIEY